MWTSDTISLLQLAKMAQPGSHHWQSLDNLSSAGGMVGARQLAAKSAITKYLVTTKFLLDYHGLANT